MHQPVQVTVNDVIVARSNDVIRVDEDDHPPRFYFPRADVNMDRLERTATTSECPFKGKAHYFRLNAEGQRLDDAVWTYEDPFDEHQALRNRVAFYDDRYPQIRVAVAR